MQFPRKGVLIRIVIYGGLISYFGWQAIQRLQAERAAEEQQQKYKDLGIPTFEVTPEEAKRLYGIDLDPPKTPTPDQPPPSPNTPPPK